ncbi:MAG: hypothetical protein M3442_15005 [Chloroflexota bacterium]|nr:hypothetical protein [Chloroflexota bacterium]
MNNAYLPHTAVKMARKLEEYDVWHFEEPIPAYDYAGLAALAAAVDIPIAAGEQEYQRWQFRDLIQIGQVDILQADVIKCGGITPGSGTRTPPQNPIRATPVARTATSRAQRHRGRSACVGASWSALRVSRAVVDGRVPVGIMTTEGVLGHLHGILTIEGMVITPHPPWRA